MSNFLKLLLTTLLTTGLTSGLVQIPAARNLALTSRLELVPSSSTCGVEVKETMCNNKYDSRQSVSDIRKSNCSEIICDQSCPYGYSYAHLGKTRQVHLEMMNPCHVLKDFSNLLRTSKYITDQAEDDEPQEKFLYYSYFFDRNTTLCSNMSDRIWNPLRLDSWAYSPLNKYSNKFLRVSPSLAMSDSWQKQALDNFGLSLTVWLKQLANNNG